MLMSQRPPVKPNHPPQLPFYAAPIPAISSHLGQRSTPAPQARFVQHRGLYLCLTGRTVSYTNGTVHVFNYI